MNTTTRRESFVKKSRHPYPGMNPVFRGNVTYETAYAIVAKGLQTGIYNAQFRAAKTLVENMNWVVSPFNKENK